MTKNRSGIKVWVLSFINGIIMLCLAFYWLSLPYTFGDEAFFIKWSLLTKKNLLDIDPKPSLEEVLFVDVHLNKTTIDVENTLGEISPYYRRVITDREQLTKFFKLINRYKTEVRFVLCDVLFEDRTPYDSLLARELVKLDDKLLGVSHLTKEGGYIRPIFDIPYAPATYTATQNIFLKFPLILNDTFKTVPLVLYERLNKARFCDDCIFYRFNGQVSLPAPIVDFKVRNSDLKRAPRLGEDNNNDTTRFTVWEMGHLLEFDEVYSLTEEEMGEFFKGKIILIGDFKEDLHVTPLGKMPGLLLIYNAYLTLVAKQNLVSIGWVGFMLISFTLLSYRELSNAQVVKPDWLVNIFRSKLGNAILNSLDELVILIFITLLSYFIFNIHINILIFLIYLKTIDFIWNKINFSKKTQ